jgi:hypothetical protein
MLGHSQPATTARYAHLADDPVKAANDVVGARIAAAMAKGKLLKNAATTESKVVTVDTKPTLPNP